ncbi:MAG: uracil-DNA glycosylase [Bacteroidales bacterium]|nr:uracil-DNA glycosylase [Bacteroidales bacterium]MDD3012049.1 uracil-DNA glycosylase [Bacteroidales bacterium]MDD3962266.1 uracil-DNA glycosylase [Bacteroidales bacterium]
MNPLSALLEQSEWRHFLSDTLESAEFKRLMKTVAMEKNKGNLFPEEPDLFKAFLLTAPAEVKVVILGQDPYHGKGQANGLAFSVNRGVKIPPSLRNIFAELHADTGDPPPAHGDLTSWARQGILLVNSVLTVREGMPGSHRNLGWQHFTDAVIKTLSRRKKGIVFLLWGNDARCKTALIDASSHHLLTAMHPSPLSAYRGFFGCRHFSATNRFLEKEHKTPIQWRIPE